VGVEVDQAREASQLAEIDRSSARGSGEIRSDRDDPPPLDEDPSVGYRATGPRVEQGSAPNQDRWRGLVGKGGSGPFHESVPR
jgi:hypothetical protein